MSHGTIIFIRYDDDDSTIDVDIGTSLGTHDHISDTLIFSMGRLP